MHDKHYVADIVINHAPLNKDVFSVESYTMILVGMHYALLRTDFLRSKSRAREAIHPKHVFICIGGSDFCNLTLKFLNDVANIDEISKISIVIGNGYSYKKLLSETIKKVLKKKSVHLFQDVNPNKIIKIMNSADFGIVPCSTILLEAISQKLPVITGFYVDNQKDIAANIKNRYDQILMIGDLREKNITSLYIDKLKLEADKSYESLINKNVQDNYIKEFNCLANEFLVKGRKAETDDVDIFFNWVNDKDVRANAINTEPVKYENHVKWFKQKIHNNHSFLYVFDNSNILIGQVRFDMEDDFYFIDYSINKKYRGKGFGRIVIKKGIELLKKESLFCQELKFKAMVKETNIASKKVFEKLNFQNRGLQKISDENYFVFTQKLR
jgi:RimJ/RimL family protein N-acetyltransferase